MLDSDESFGPFGTDPDVLHRCDMTDEQVAKSPLMPYFDEKAFNTSLKSQCENQQECHA